MSRQPGRHAPRSDQERSVAQAEAAVQAHGFALRINCFYSPIDDLYILLPFNSGGICQQLLSFQFSNKKSFERRSVDRGMTLLCDDHDTQVGGEATGL